MTPFSYFPLPFLLDLFVHIFSVQARLIRYFFTYFSSLVLRVRGRFSKKDFSTENGCRQGPFPFCYWGPRGSFPPPGPSQEASRWAAPEGFFFSLGGICDYNRAKFPPPYFPFPARLPVLCSQFSCPGTWQMSGISAGSGDFPHHPPIGPVGLEEKKFFAVLLSPPPVIN